LSGADVLGFPDAVIESVVVEHAPASNCAQSEPNAFADAKTLNPIFPKLWRRLFSDFKGNPSDMKAFLAFIAAQNERLHTLSDGRFIAFDDVLKFKNGKLRMTYKPEDIVFEPK
jgi:hypothetical protein